MLRSVEPLLKRSVQEGMYVNEGTSIFEIAELSTLWNISEINEKDLAFVKLGSRSNYP